MKNSIIKYNDTPISIREDGYWNASEMCRANNKQVNDFLRLNWSKQYLEVLSTETGIPVSLLVQVKHGGKLTEQGTWVDRRIALRIAQWCSPPFAVFFDIKMAELFSTGVTTIRNAKCGKLVTWDAFASEDSLSELIFSFVSGICSYRFLEREMVFLNTVADQPKTRRLDFVARFSKVVYGYELKLNRITIEDVEKTLEEKNYYQILSNFVINLDESRNRKVRPVKFILMSPRGITKEAKDLLETIPEVSYISVQEFCRNHLRKVWLNKYKMQQPYLASVIVNKYPQLFNRKTIKGLETWLSDNKLKSLPA